MVIAGQFYEMIHPSSSTFVVYLIPISANVVGRRSGMGCSVSGRVEPRKGCDICDAPDRLGVVDGLGPRTLDLFRVGKTGGFNVLREYVLAAGSEVKLSEMINSFGGLRIFDVDDELSSERSKAESVDDLEGVWMDDPFLDQSREAPERIERDDELYSLLPGEFVTPMEKILAGRDFSREAPEFSL